MCSEVSRPKTIGRDSIPWPPYADVMRLAAMTSAKGSPRDQNQEPNVN
jgi:hypothetical protein